MLRLFFKSFLTYVVSVMMNVKVPVIRYLSKLNKGVFQKTEKCTARGTCVVSLESFGNITHLLTHPALKKIQDAAQDLFNIGLSNMGDLVSLSLSHYTLAAWSP